MTDCVFCKIVARATFADIVYEDDDVVAFKDIYPKAPVHLLIVPRRHIPSLSEVSDGDIQLMGRCVRVARTLAEQTGFVERGFRLSVNTGPDSGQVVYHVHFHFTAGHKRKTDV